MHCFTASTNLVDTRGTSHDGHRDCSSEYRIYYSHRYFLASYGPYCPSVPHDQAHSSAPSMVQRLDVAESGPLSQRLANGEPKRESEFLQSLQMKKFEKEF
jgi:hypothetical protein